MSGIVFVELPDLGAESGALPAARLYATDATTGGNYALCQLPGLHSAANDDYGSGSGLVGLRLRALDAGMGTQYAIAALPMLGSIATGGVAIPDIGVTYGALPALLGASHGFTTTFGNVDTAVPLRCLAFDGTGYSNAALPALNCSSFMLQPLLNYLMGVQTPGYMSIISTQLFPTILWADTLAMSSAFIPQWVMVRMAELGIGLGTVTDLLKGLCKLQENIGFDDVAIVVWRFLIDEVLGASGTGTLSGSVLLQIAESIALLAGVGSQLKALNAVIEALGILGAQGYIVPFSQAEALNASATPVQLLLAINRDTEMLGLSGAAVGYATFTVLDGEELGMNVGGATQANLFNAITEGMEILARFSLPDGEYLAWVCNTESKAFTSYRNFPFNSFAEIQGHYYGATDTGVYLLEGDDDAGEPIDARIRSGLMDFGTGLLKRMPSLYLGYRTTGQLVLKMVTTTDGGDKTESWYSLEQRAATDLRESRFKIGKGLKSTYWGFEIANVDGADFELDTMSFLPMVLERRI